MSFISFSHTSSDHRIPFKVNRWLWFFVMIFFCLWVYTFIGTPDMGNWLIENALVSLFLIFLVISYRYYQFSDLSYLLITLYLCLVIYGAMYTFAENPMGFWLKDALQTPRNPYDRLVHFSFGFLLAYPMREMFLKWLKFPSWVAWILPIEITLSMSGFYEIIEWLVAAVFFPEQGVAYLGVQGDVWDAQKDITVATLGAIFATSILSSVKRVFKIH